MKKLSLATGAALFAALLAQGVNSGQSAEESARASVTAFYEALSAAPATDAAALLTRAVSPAWVSCGGNDVCRGLDQVLPAVAARRTAVPDLKWQIKEMLVSGNRVIVRGEASGTPAGDFVGVPYGGKSFDLMSIDIHTLDSGKLVRSYHVEDWMGAIRQLSAK